MCVKNRVYLRPIYMHRIVLLLFIFLLSQHGLAQRSSLDTLQADANIWQTFKYDAKSAFGGFKHSITAPARWQGDDYLTAVSVLTVTSMFTALDQSARNYFVEQEPQAPGVLKEFGWYFGSPQNFFMVSGGIYGFGLLTKNEKVRKTGVLIIASAATSGLFQTFFKTAVGRARPDDFTGPFEFEPFKGTARYHSFPSGHTILSISMAHSIAKQFDNFWVKSGIYALGSIAPISRLWDDAHWASDIVLGAAISIAVVDSVDNFLFGSKRYENTYKNRNRISWRFTAGPNTVGLLGTF